MGRVSGFWGCRCPEREKGKKEMRERDGGGGRLGGVGGKGFLGFGDAGVQREERDVIVTAKWQFLVGVWWLRFLRLNKGRTQCTRLPLYAGSGRGECRLALPPFMERLLPSLEPETYRSWAKALAIAPSDF
ncbi:hypothetical protein DVH24_019135 [Malus domestica]|uniref:Uncharacterized protein n=1 Tax=Malus domestica TaxID=3750 RepID=A0A498I2U0_MALDO|nr:hypothetical protein DVH24_019135 [Malus domestica]